jgi:hypothetical protein
MVKGFAGLKASMADPDLPGYHRRLSHSTMVCISCMLHAVCQVEMIPAEALGFRFFKLVDTSAAYVPQRDSAARNITSPHDRPVFLHRHFTARIVPHFASTATPRSASSNTSELKTGTRHAKTTSCPSTTGALDLRPLTPSLFRLPRHLLPRSLPAKHMADPQTRRRHRRSSAPRQPVYRLRLAEANFEAARRTPRLFLDSGEVSEGAVCWPTGSPYGRSASHARYGQHPTGRVSLRRCIAGTPS